MSETAFHPITVFFDMVAGRPGMAGPNYRAFVRSIDLTGDAGVAVLVETDYLGCDFVDYFSVARIDEPLADHQQDVRPHRRTTPGVLTHPMADFVGVDGWTDSWAPATNLDSPWSIFANGTTPGRPCVEGARVVEAAAAETN